MLHLVGCLCYLYQWCTVKQISDNEIYLLIKYTKSNLWRVAKRLSYIEDARCLTVKKRKRCWTLWAIRLQGLESFLRYKPSLSFHLNFFKFTRSIISYCFLWFVLLIISVQFVSSSPISLKLYRRNVGYLFYIRPQIVPHRKHSPYRLKTPIC